MYSPTSWMHGTLVTIIGAGQLAARRALGYASSRVAFPATGNLHTERVVAIVRVLLATVSLVAVYYDPTAPAAYVGFTYTLLVLYALYSLWLLALLGSSRPRSRYLFIAIHASDVLAATLLTLFTEGPSSPFFVLFGFTLLTAGYRWGFWETAATGLVSLCLLGLEALLVSGVVGADVVEGVFELNRFIIRCAYLLLLAFAVGYLAEAEKRASTEAAARASVEERARLANELHDSVIQSLIGLRMRMESLQARVEADAAVTGALVDASDILSREVSNLRAVMFALKPIEDGPEELSAALADLVHQFGHSHHVITRFVSTTSDDRVPATVRHEIRRIVREALINVHRHSEARHVVVSLSASSGLWHIVVEDDGRGFDFEGRLAHDELDREAKGPRTIKERVRRLGGRITVESTRRSGARLEIALPRSLIWM